MVMVVIKRYIESKPTKNARFWRGKKDGFDWEVRARLLSPDPLLRDD